MTSVDGTITRRMSDSGSDNESEVSFSSSLASANSQTLSDEYADDDDHDDAAEQWAQQLHELILLLNMVLLPLMGKYFGRQFALWSWEKWITWRSPFSMVIKGKGVQRATSAVLAAGVN